MSKYRLGDYTIKNWNAWDNVPRDPATIGYMIVHGGTYAAAGTAVAASTFIAAAGYYALGFVATTLVASALQSSLGPKLAAGSSAGSSGLLVNSGGPTQSAEVVYGQIRKGGAVTFNETSGGKNKYLHQIIVLAAHEVEEIGDIYINDQVVTMAGSAVTSNPWKRSKEEAYIAGYESDTGDPIYATRTITTHYINIYKHTGNQTSKDSYFSNASVGLADTLMNEVTDLEDSFVGKGLAYLYCRFQYDKDVFASGIPTITAVVKGKKVVKTVNGVAQSPVYSNNSAWVLRDFLTSNYGLNDDQIDNASFEAAADVCDDTSVLSNGYEQYQVNGVVGLSQKIGDVLTDLVATCGGSLFWGGGYWKLYAGEFITPTKTLTLDDIRSPISLQTKSSIRDNFNRVSGTFIDKDNDWISTDYPPIESSVFLNDDNNIESSFDLTLPYTTDSKIAQRLAKQMLYRSREQLQFSADFGLNALDVEVGDFIKFQNERYWGAASPTKTFEVIGWRLNPSQESGALNINLTLRESSSEAYGFSVSDERAIVSNNSTLLRYYEVPTVGINLSQEYRVINQTVVNILVVEVTSSDVERLDSVILEYRKTSETIFRSVGQSTLINEDESIGRFEIVGIDTPSVGESAINYTVRVTPVNSIGFRGEPQTTTINIVADTIPPSSPSSLDHSLSGGTAFFTWPSVSDLDLSHYKLYYSSNASANFGDASVQTKVEKIARPATSITQPALAGKFFVSAVDKTGNESTTAATTIISSSELPQLGASQTSTENNLFNGTKSNLTVSGSRLFMTTYTSAGSTGTYSFDHGGVGYLDVSTSRTIRCSYAVTYERKHLNAVSGEVNWDDIPQNWDTWPNNWDTWTDEDAAFSDYAVLVQVRAATTTGGLSSASWVDGGSEVVGRYVQFRAILSNTNENVTPSISALTATVEY